MFITDDTSSEQTTKLGNKRLGWLSPQMACNRERLVFLHAPLLNLAATLAPKQLILECKAFSSLPVTSGKSSMQYTHSTLCAHWCAECVEQLTLSKDA